MPNHFQLIRNNLNKLESNAKPLDCLIIQDIKDDLNKIEKEVKKTLEKISKKPGVIIQFRKSLRSNFRNDNQKFIEKIIC